MGRSRQVVEFARDAVQNVVCDYLTDIAKDLRSASSELAFVKKLRLPQLLEWVRFRERLQGAICKILVIRKTLRAFSLSSAFLTQVDDVLERLQKSHGKLQCRPTYSELSGKYLLVADEIAGTAEVLRSLAFPVTARGLLADYFCGILSVLSASISVFALSFVNRAAWIDNNWWFIGIGVVFGVASAMLGFEQQRRNIED